MKRILKKFITNGLLTSLKNILENTGFTEVNRSNFDPDYDSEVRRTGSLYVEAVKPKIY